MNNRTPDHGSGIPDSEQLPLGAFEGVPMLPIGGQSSRDGGDGGDGGNSGDAGDAVLAVTVREPPVCGEWSFDQSDDADSRNRATLVDASAPVRASGDRPATGYDRAQPAAPPKRLPSGPHRLPAAPRSMTPPTPLPALDELKSIHDARPGDARTAIALATALDKRGNIEGALTVLERAIAAGADAVALRCARAGILSGRLRYDDAEVELKRALKLRADDPAVLLQQGVLACRRAKWRDAVEPLAHVVRLSPSSAAAQFYLGEALNKLDRLPDALDAYERAAELEPSNWRALKGVGIVLDRMGRPADAAVYYRRARDAQSG